jgi:hypothetical protein
MIENIQKRLLSQLPFWKSLIKARLESTIIIFHNPYSRRRFCFKCLRTPAQQVIARDLFSNGPPLLAGGRVWGVVVKASQWLLDRRDYIQSNWSLARMQGAGNDGEEDLEESEEEGDIRQSKHMVRADSAISDDFWWSLLDLVNLFADLLGALENWSNACKCHPRDFREHCDLHLDAIKCPLRMCRAVCLACEGINRFFSQISATLVSQILATHSATLDAAQRAQLIDYFGIGKQFIYVELVLRIDRGWAALPLRALGMGATSEDVAIDVLIDCLAQFEALDPAEIAPLDFILFSREGPLRGQVLGIVQRTHTWDQVPGLRRYRMIAQFIPVVETSVERRHVHKFHSRIFKILYQRDPK